MDAIILAAGASTRMGRPKALVEYEGRPALELIEQKCYQADVERAIVVLGRDAQEIASRVRLEPRTSVVEHRAWALGRTGSLQAARSDGIVLVWPVDHPLASAATARALLAARGEWRVPRVGERAGHPIVLAGRAWDAVRAAAPDAPLRDVLRAAGVERVDVPVDDAGALANLDTPGF